MSDKRARERILKPRDDYLCANKTFQHQNEEPTHFPCVGLVGQGRVQEEEEPSECSLSEPTLAAGVEGSKKSEARLVKIRGNKKTEDIPKEENVQ